MVQSRAATVDEYLDELAPDRREVIEQVLAVIRDNLPDGYEEGILWGMVCWYIPLDRYPDTYNGQPLELAALAAQKRHYAVYLSIYDDDELREEFEQRYRESGKPMDVGKSCVLFTKLENLPLDVIAWPSPRPASRSASSATRSRVRRHSPLTGCPRHRARHFCVAREAAARYPFPHNQRRRCPPR